MSRVPFSDEETRVIFGEGTLASLSQCDGKKQEKILKKLRDICESVSPPDQFIYEKIQNVDIIRPGDACRLYTKVVTYIPEGNTEYHIVYVLYIDADHEYDHGNLVTFNEGAQAKLECITALETVDDVELYLSEHDAMGADDLSELLNR